MSLYKAMKRKAREIEASYPSDGTCARCGSAPRNDAGLCATCVDEDSARATPPSSAVTGRRKRRHSEERE